jgi:hypothetical protein
MNIRICLLAVLLSQMTLRGVVVAADQPSAASLERGSVEQRLWVLVKILDIPRDQRSPAVWRAIKREATRMLEVRRRPPRDTDDDQEITGAYSAGLVRALGESRDPGNIPILIAYAGATTYATDALVRFGDLAVPAMLRTATAKQDLDEKGGVAQALANMLGTAVKDPIAPLSEAGRQQIGSFADRLLDTKLSYYDLVNVSYVAAATGRPDLREELERLAEDREAWTRRGVTDAFEITLGQRIIQAQLKKNPRP